jgi:hypothetical protein
MKKQIFEEYIFYPEDYLKRGYNCLKNGKREYLFYAALELRCGIEARLREHLSDMEAVSKSIRNGWQIGFLGKEIEKIFKNRENGYLFNIDLKKGSKSIMLLYTPVSLRLQEIGNRLGDYLHAQKKEYMEDDPWWDNFKKLLIEGHEHLAVAMMGTLTRPPLRNPNTLEIKLSARVNKIDGRRLILALKDGIIKNENILISQLRFEYLLSSFQDSSNIFKKL